MTTNHKDVEDHLLVLEGGKISYVRVPTFKTLSVADNTELCFTNHHNATQDGGSNSCCLWETEHIHAHFHHGEITEDVRLEQCLEEACCALPVPWDFTGSSPSEFSYHNEHEHKEGCGHNKVAHGDHVDWLVPMKDGSFLLSHPQMSKEGSSEFVEHGRLVKVGESLGKLQRNSKLVDLFRYVSPKAKGYESLPQREEVSETNSSEPALDGYCGFLSSPGMAIKSPTKDEMVEIAIPEKYKGQGLERTVLDVMGICCPAEIPLIKKILEPLPGVEEVSVNVTSKTVTVLHDHCLTADTQLVKTLNEARMDASIHLRGQVKTTHKWPSPWTIACGVLLVVAFFEYLYNPLRWVALGAVAIGLPPVVLRSLVSIRQFVLDINVLMLIAVGGAVALGDYLEAGSIVFLFTIADWLESRSSYKARAAISSLMNLVPQSAILAENGQRVPVEDIKLNTLIAIKSGEMIPIDGTVVSGKCSVDESSLTGESRPVEKDVGVHVWAGTLILSGFVTVETTAVSEDSAVARMVKLVEEAHSKHSRTEQVVEHFAKYYTPVLVSASVAVAIVPLAAHVHNERHWFYLAIVLLVVACPCALVISTPVTVTCGITQAAREGLIIKGGNFLEALGKLKIIAIDKTGTLTEGHFAVSQLLPVSSTVDMQQLMYWIASVESKSSHPIAPALVAYARLHGVEISQETTDFEHFPGEGVSAIVDGHTIQIGNERLASRLGWLEDVDCLSLEKSAVEGSTIGWVGVDGKCQGIYSIADQPRPEAFEALESLKVGGIDFHAQLLPEGKVTFLEELKSTGTTAMIGDGINDAPALAAADVGIAMGVAGSAVAMETAHIALMTNDLRKLATAVILGRHCRSKIQQNVFLSILTKAIIIALAAGGYASLWAAVLADVGTCIVVIFNSMRVLKGVDNEKLPKTMHHSGFSFGHCFHSHHRDDCCTNKCAEDSEAPKSCCQDSSGGHVGKTIRRRLGLKESCTTACEKGSTLLSSATACCTETSFKASKCCSEDLNVTSNGNVRPYQNALDLPGNHCNRAGSCGIVTNANKIQKESTQPLVKSDFVGVCCEKPSPNGTGGVPSLESIERRPTCCTTNTSSCCEDINRFADKKHTSNSCRRTMLQDASRQELAESLTSPSIGCGACCNTLLVPGSEPLAMYNQLQCCTVGGNSLGEATIISSPHTPHVKDIPTSSYNGPCSLPKLSPSTGCKKSCCKS